MSYHDNLRRLKEALLKEPPRLDVLDEKEHAERAARLSQRMPLSHGTASKNFLSILQSEHLLTHAEKYGKTPPADSDEVLLGTQDFVFFYAAPFGYPKSTCGFLFKTTLEHGYRDSGEATPFDSGGLNHHLKTSFNLTERRVFLEKHKLPIPNYREYLELFLVQCFDTPEDYIEGNPPVIKPVDLDDHTNERSWLMEVRIPGNVPVQAHLLAVWMPKAKFGVDAFVRFRLYCKKNNVYVKHFQQGQGTFDNLRKYSQIFIKHHVGAAV
ncbi:MAG: hypothetical protein QNK37_26730 [Acidobacteriota bacterium]|nr:hypothetical protein [Acidobacteriota bacterium]